jgi:hypothetical protein
MNGVRLISKVEYFTARNHSAALNLKIIWYHHAGDEASRHDGRKLSAIITRKKPAMHDVFDSWFFLENHWPVNEKVFEQKTRYEPGKRIEISSSKLKAFKVMRFCRVWVS